MLLLLYLGVVLIGVIIPFVIIVYVFLSIIVELFGAPFVPTSQKVIDEILKNAKLKPNSLFVELGSGDGRVVRRAVQKYRVRGIGVEIHPYLYIYSRLKAKIEQLDSVHFRRQSFFTTDLTEADILFLFLLPRTLKKLKDKLLKECKRNCVIISHGFKIPDWDSFIIKKTDRKTFPTYYYKITKR